jgi:hypothetical protein
MTLPLYTPPCDERTFYAALDMLNRNEQAQELVNLFRSQGDDVLYVRNTARTTTEQSVIETIHHAEQLGLVLRENFVPSRISRFRIL